MLKKLSFKTLPLIPPTLLFGGLYFSYIAFTTFHNIGLGAGFTIVLTISIGMIVSAILLCMYSSIFLVTILNFNQAEDMPIPAFQYTICFIFVHVTYGLTMDMIHSLFEKEWNAGFSAVFPSPLLVAYLFILKYKRVMTLKEQHRIIFQIFSVSFIFGALIFGFLFAVGEIKTQIQWMMVLAIFTLSAAATYVSQRLTFGWFSRRFLLRAVIDRNKKIAT